jgi:toxin secretion/phage lysis holin
MKAHFLCFSLGAVGAGIASVFGGFDAALVTLIIFMAIDYVTGLIVAGVFHRSPKTETGALESKAGLKGLLRKGGMLLVVLIACRLDLMLGAHFIRDAVVIALVSNEALSIVENLGLMGVPIPTPVINAIEVLKSRADETAMQTTAEKPPDMGEPIDDKTDPPT